MKSLPTARVRVAPLAAATAALLAAACSDPSAPRAPTAAPSVAAAGEQRASRLIADNYVVVLKDGVVDVDAKAERAAKEHGGSIKHVYKAALRGFAIRLPDALAARLAADPDVAYVEQEQEFTATTTQSPATWGLDRIDQVALPLSGSFTYTNTGAGVRAYIIDTGIRVAHTEFGGRAVAAYTVFNGGKRASEDCNGHGTHVAGTVGGRTYGVAKGVSLYAVRVLDCSGSGTTSGVIAGVDYVRTQKQANPGIPMVANMSLGGGRSPSLDQAVINAINADVTFAVAAGNSNVDACTASPAGVTTAVTVGARRARTRARRTPTTAPASTSSPPVRRSRARGTRATPRRTRSVGRRWPPRTLPASPRCSSRATRARSRPPSRRS
jgi:subtilisin family serine protease